MIPPWLVDMYLDEDLPKHPHAAYLGTHGAKEAGRAAARGKQHARG